MFANRGPIQRGRFPGRFPKRRRKTAYEWSSFLLNNDINIDTTATTIQLLNYADYIYTSGFTPNGRHKLHRLCCKFTLTMDFNQAAQEELASRHLIWAVYQTDVEDTDDQLWNATGNVFASKRIWKWDEIGFNAYEGALATSTDMPHYQRGIPIKFDLRFKRPVLWEPDAHIVLTTQWLASVSSAIAVATVKGVVRAVVQPAQMGR